MFNRKIPFYIKTESTKTFINELLLRYQNTLFWYPPFVSLMKQMVEVGRIELPSLSNRVKVATCLAPYFKLILATPAEQDCASRSLLDLALVPKANLPEPA